MDTKFSVAVQVLILVAESSEPMNSEQMAESVGTNASYIRKILSLLKKADIVDGHRGISGYSLAVSPDNLTLLQIYRAVTDGEKIHLLDMPPLVLSSSDVHQNANDKCIVGRHIKPVLTEMFADLEDSFALSLKSKTLADCIADIRNKLQ